jgi:endo-1,4-beta-xylanase
MFLKHALRKANLTFFATVMVLLSTNMVACKKSSADEDFAPTETIKAEGDDSEMAATTSSNVNWVKGATLKGSFTFPIGVAVVKERLEDPIYGNLVAKEFSSLTAESSMKFGAVQPEQGKWTFSKADAIVAFAQKYHMRVHGHTLIWAKDGTNPKWLNNFKGNRAAWLNLMKIHIQTVVSRYKGKVASWDVVNEGIDRTGALIDNVWLRNIGRDYLGYAFKYAHAADPDAKLFYNDYDQEFGGAKMRTILSLIAESKKNGVPLQGIGFQAHTVLRIEPERFYDNMKLVADAGMLVHISEIDISMRYQKGDTFPLTPELAAEQGAKYKALVKAYMTAVPKKLQFGITTWGVCDFNSYFNHGYPNSDHDYPLLFDKNYNPKPAYKSFVEAGLGI